MARPRMKGVLSQISLSIAEHMEEPVADLLENIFGTPPSIYTDANSRKTTASIFIEKSSQWNSRIKAQLLARLKELRANGIDTGPCKISIKKLQRQDWAESWKKHFQPIQVGDALLIKPSWSRLLPKKNQACVVLDPGLSFGTGQHATTLFCLEQLVHCRRPHAKQSFLDIGTGSGILAISAAKLGYSPIRALDFDPESVRISRTNAAKNKVENLVHPICQDLTQLPLESKTRFDVICANLIYDLLLSESERILNRLSPSGSLILAGILKIQFAQVKKCFERLGLVLQKSKVGKEWKSGYFIFQK
ncbi:MAG: 50S ribosomal protein L11 methyltransferase [Verrucomicrobiota bacterium]